MQDKIVDLYGNDDVEAMYQAALRVPLSDKIQMAIQLIQTFESQALSLSEDGYYVCFSGGKDSIVMAKLFEMSGVKYNLNYSNVTIDPPELVQFIKREYPEAIWHSQGKHLLRYMVDKGKSLPTRKVRWCCQVYKEQGGTGKFKSIGVRAPESPRRKGLWKTVNNNNGGTILCPIVYWTDEDVWDFIRQNDMKYCTLYDEGYKRLGCIVCPMSGANRQRKFNRYPKYEQMWKQATIDFYNKWVNVPTIRGEDRSIKRFSSGEELFEWWMTNESVDDFMEPDCQLYLW